MDIKELTLNTKVQHYFYGEGKINRIESKRILVQFKCKFVKPNYFELWFLDCTNTSEYTTNNQRHILELTL